MIHTVTLKAAGCFFFGEFLFYHLKQVSKNKLAEFLGAVIIFSYRQTTLYYSGFEGIKFLPSVLNPVLRLLPAVFIYLFRCWLLGKINPFSRGKTFQVTGITEVEKSMICHGGIP